MALVLDVLALVKHLSAALSLNNADTYRYIVTHGYTQLVAHSFFNGDNVRGSRSVTSTIAGC